jgi:hypothetical protein
VILASGAEASLLDPKTSTSRAWVAHLYGL